MVLEYVTTHSGGLPGPAEGGMYSCYEEKDASIVVQNDGGTNTLFTITFSRGSNVQEAAGIETESFA